MCIAELIEDHASEVETNLESYREDWVNLVESVKTDIDDDCRASDDFEDTTPGIQLTIATDDGAEDWGYQTGDNSYSGAAYHFPHWAVVEVYRDSDANEVAEDVSRQLADLIFQ